MSLYDSEFPPSIERGQPTTDILQSTQSPGDVQDEGRLPSSQDARIFGDGSGVTWWVHEVSGDHVGARGGATCLLVVSALELRRVWRFPAHWRSLSSEELLRLGDQPPRRDTLR